MKSYKGGGKYAKTTDRPIKKKTLKLTTLKSKPLRTKGLAKYKLKTFKKIERKPEKIMEMFMKGKENDFDTYYNALKGFHILFKNMLKEEEKLFNEENDDIKTSYYVLEIKNGKYMRGQMVKEVLGGTSKGLLHRICNDLEIWHHQILLMIYKTLLQNI